MHLSLIHISLMLRDTGGNIRDIFHTGALRVGVTSGRSQGSASRVFYTHTTKGTDNPSSGISGFVAEPLFSDRTLYHEEAFTLSLSCPTAGAVIRYTLDGNSPTTDSTAYTCLLYTSRCV